ncbi:MAG: Lrp/AsnC family transcriptional regulator [Candidatus Micrarchaeota archaeon]
MIDERDLYIIEALLENSQTPLSSIGKELGISDTAVRKRITQLKDYGVIEGYSIKINPKNIGFNMHAFVGLDTYPEEYLHVMERLKKVNEIKSLFASTGDHMLMAEVWANTRKRFEEVVKEIENTKGVSKVCPAILVERVK